VVLTHAAFQYIQQSPVHRVVLVKTLKFVLASPTSFS
jgi:hypothetical protein